MNLVGREEEQAILEYILNSNKAEFLAIYGRRRVGKTYLIREFFESKKIIFFNTTGTYKAKLSEQIKNFIEQVGDAFLGGVTPQACKNWNEAFKVLTDAIKTVDKSKKIVLFLDEFPWMATKNSNLLHQLEYFWNQHWSRDRRIKLIICGSSASWIIDKIIYNKGGLHNRVTETIRLDPLTLKNTKKFLRKMNVTFTNKQVSTIYMVTGGIPFYLTKIKPGISAVEAIEKLAFSNNSFLLDEFDKLFSSLFDEADIYIEILRLIASRRHGIAQEQLFEGFNKISKGIGGLSKLKALEEAGFIMSFVPHLNKIRGKFYKIIDEYTLFYFYWIEPIRTGLIKKGLRKGYWQKSHTMSVWRSWCGYSFEAICYKHLAQISEALDLNQTAIPTSWRFVPPKGSNEQGAQIDLLFDRDDDAITLCEIKFTEQPFVVDKEYAKKLQEKVAVFREKTKTKKQIILVMISANGIKKTIYSEELISAVITMDDLFKGQ